MASSASAKALLGLSLLEWNLGSRDAPEERARQSYALYREIDDSSGMGWANNLLGLAALTGKEHEGVAVRREACRLFRAAGDDWGLLNALRLLGAYLTRRGCGQAEAYLEQSLALCRKQGDRVNLCRLLYDLGNSALQRGRYDRAAALIEESLPVAREVGNKFGIAQALRQTGVLRRCRGQYDKAEEPLLRGLLIWCEIGDPSQCAQCLAELATIARARLQMSRSARLFGVADAIWALPYLNPSSFCPDVKKPVAEAYNEMKPTEGYSEARAQVEGMPLEEALAWAFGVSHISRICP